MGKITAVLLASILLLSVVMISDESADGIRKKSAPKIKPKTKIETNKTFNVYVEPLPSGVDPQYANVIDEAFKLWEKYAKVKFVKTSSKSKSSVVVSWAMDFTTAKYEHKTNLRNVVIGLGDYLCIDTWQAYDYETVKQIAQHAFGHVVGRADDRKNPNDVMYYQQQYMKYNTDLEETVTATQGYGFWWDTCTRNDVSNYWVEVSTTNEYDGVDVYFMTSRQDFDLFINGETFTYYPECSTTGTINYKQSCEGLPPEAILVVYNGYEDDYSSVEVHVMLREL